MDAFQSPQLVDSKSLRRTYLVNYGLADLKKILIRKRLRKWIKKNFSSGSDKVKIKHWACAKGKHQNSQERYHVALRRHSCSARRSAHLFTMAISSYSLEERKQPQIIFIQYSCSVTMIISSKKICEGKFMN